MGAIAEPELGVHIVDDVLDRPFGVRDLASDLTSAQALGHQFEDHDLSPGEAVEVEAPGGQDVALELTDAFEEPPEKIRGQRRIARRCGPHRFHERFGGGLGPTDQSEGPGLDRKQESRVVNPLQDEHASASALLQLLDDTQRLVVDLVGNDDAHGRFL